MLMLGNGSIQLRGRLGAGGMGCVFLANHPRLGREVAVKVLRDDTVSEDSMARVRREARLTARVDSPHVVRLLDCLTAANGAPYLVMEKVPGAPLATRLRQKTRLSTREVCSIIRQLSSALSAVHAAGVVHADVKPENVILGRNTYGSLRVTLIDFGIARSEDEVPLHEDAFPTGTASAMSPEQILDPGVARTSWDVWGLAVLAYTALTGHLPYEGENLAAVLFAAARGDRRSVTWFRSELGPNVDLVFERAFARLAADRFATANELSKALDAALLGELGVRSVTRLAA